MKSARASKIGPEIGIDLVAHVAGQEAEPLAGLDGGTRQDQALDGALFEQKHGVADGEPGLAGAGRAFGEDQFVAFQGAQIKVLRGVARPHGAAPARADLLEGDAARLGLLGEQRALQRAFLDRAVDVAERHRLAELYAPIEIFEHKPGVLAGVLRALDRDEIAVGVGDDAEPALKLGEILIVMAKHQRGVAIVVEGEIDLDAVGLALRALDLGPWKRDGTIGWFQTDPRGVWTGSGRDWASRPAGKGPPEQGIGAGRDDLDSDDGADEAGVGFDLDGLEIAGLAGDLAGVAAALLDEDIERAADHARG